MIARGDVYWVDYGGAVGGEIRKIRPSVVVSQNGHNAHMRTVTVVPLSSGSPRVDYEVAVPAGTLADGRPARLKPHQLRAVDRRRFGRRLGRLPPPLMLQLEAALRLHLALGD